MAEVVLCIGAGEAQIPYLEEARSLGYRLYCTDGNSSAPGFQLADRHVVSSTFDAEATPMELRALLADGDEVAGVIAPCTGPPLRTRDVLRQQLGLESIPKNSVDVLLDKRQMRMLSNSMGLSDIRLYAHIDELADVGSPVLLKPRFDGMGGAGVEIFPHGKAFQSVHPEGQWDDGYMVEGYIAGNELAIDAIWDGREILFVGPGWSLFDSELGMMVGSTAQNDTQIAELKPQITLMLENICRELELGPEVLNADIVVDDQGKLHLIELEFVPADGIMLTERSYDFNMVALYVALHLGQDIALKSTLLKASAVIGDFYDTPTLEDLKVSEKIAIDYIRLPIRKVRTDVGQRVFRGVYLLTADSAQDLYSGINSTFPTVTHNRVINGE